MKNLVLIFLILSSVVCLIAETKIDIVEFPETKTVGMSTLISSDFNIMGMLWSRFMAREAELSNVIKEEVGLGITYDMEDFGEGKYLFAHMAAMMVSDYENIPEGMTTKTIPAGKYAKFTHIGPLSTLHTTYMKIYSEILPASQFKGSEGGIEFEWYDERFKMESEESEIDIYIQVKPKE